MIWQASVPVLYDIEYTGNITNDFGKGCAIWEISLKTVNGEDTYHSYVDYTNEGKREVLPPVETQFIPPSPEQLAALNAKPFPVVLAELNVFFQQLKSKMEKQFIILMSHNGHKGDKIIMEHELDYYGINGSVVFQEIYFADTLYLIRDNINGLKRYSLQAIVEAMLPEKKDFKQHSAINDVQALWEIFNRYYIPLEGPVYGWYTIPFRNITGIGKYKEQTFLQLGLMNVNRIFENTYGDNNGLKGRLIIYLQEIGINTEGAIIPSLLLWYKLYENFYLKYMFHDV